MRHVKDVKRLIELGASRSTSQRTGTKRVYMPANLYLLPEKDLREVVQIVHRLAMVAAVSLYITPLYRDTGELRGWIYRDK